MVAPEIEDGGSAEEEGEDATPESKRSIWTEYVCSGDAGAYSVDDGWVKIREGTAFDALGHPTSGRGF